VTTGNARPKEASGGATGARFRWALVGLVAVAAAVTIIVILRRGTLKGALVSVLGLTQRLSERHLAASMLIIIAGYVVACVFFLPGLVLTVGTGFVLKTLWGTVTVSIGSTLGACAAFLVGRTVARKWVEAKLAGDPRFAAVDRAVGREGFKIVLLTRLSPVFPFNLLNYGYGLTKVSFGHYALASWIGMLPWTVVFVYSGAGLGSLAEVAEGAQRQTTAERVLFWLGLAVAVGVAVFVARVARRALKEAVSEGPLS